jgi:uncharacterized membrane protein
MIRGFCSIVFQRETLRPVLALAAVSAIAMGLVGTRILLSQSLKHGYLAWNLFLAWLPVILLSRVRAHLANPRFASLEVLDPGNRVAAFSPERPVHFHRPHAPRTPKPRTFLVDLVLIVMTAWTASLVGFLSLYVMQTLVSRRYGWVTGWGFAAIVSGLVGLGIYIGRFLRWNSWDVLVNPFGIARDMFVWAMQSVADKRLVIYPMLFALLFFAAHVTLAAFAAIAAQPVDDEQKPA